MAVDPRLRAQTAARTVNGPARGGLPACVQAQLVALRTEQARCCSLCGRPIRGGQDAKHLHGTAAHARCTHPLPSMVRRGRAAGPASGPVLGTDGRAL